MEHESELDQILSELVAVHDELMALPNDDFERRVELRSRRNELRQQAAQIADMGPISPSAFKSALAGLIQLRDEILDSHIESGADSDTAANLNHAIDRARDLPQVEAELRRLLARIEDARSDTTDD